MTRSLHIRVGFGAIIAFAFMLNVTAALGQVPCRYEVAHIIQGPPGTPPFDIPATYGQGISPNGRYVCGRYTYLIDDLPFIYDTQTSQFMTIPMPAGIYAASVADINDNGIAVGTAIRTNIGQRGFVYNLHTGVWTELLPLTGGVYSSATGINASNVVCGWRSIGPGINPTTAFRWSANTGFQDLGLMNNESTSAVDISDDNAVAGRMNVANVLHPFLWVQSGTLIDLGTLLGFTTTPNGMNGSHQVVGASNSQQFPPTQSRAFHWESGSMSNLGVLPGFNQSTALAISDSGLVVGRCSVSGQSFPKTPVLWIDGAIMDLSMIIHSKSGAELDVPQAISQSGRIAGEGRTAEGITIGIVLDPVLAPHADINHDCRVGVPDLLAVINTWHETESPSDINHDRIVDLLDLMMVIRDWTFD